MSSAGGKQKAVRGALMGVLIFTAYQYSRVTFDNNLAWAQLIMMGMEEKPYVYRALVPWLAHLLVLLGVRADVALTALVILSAMGLFYGIKYLLATFRRV